MEAMLSSSVGADAAAQTERPWAAWKASVLSADFALDVSVCLVIAASPLALAQHGLPTPVQRLDVAGASPLYARAFLLDRPLQSDTVPTWALVLIVLAPLALALALSVGAPARGAVRAWVRSYMYTVAVTQLVVESGKRYCGYWRPYFLDECGFDVATGACAGGVPAHALRSFPSSHAALATASMLHSSLRLLGACRLGASPHALRLGRGLGGRAFEVDTSGVATLGCLLPTLLALWVGASRVRDGAHHPADVVGGVLVGGASACFWYLRYFRAPFGPEAHLPRAAAQC